MKKIATKQKLISEIFLLEKLEKELILLKKEQAKLRRFRIMMFTIFFVLGFFVGILLINVN